MICGWRSYFFALRSKAARLCQWVLTPFSSMFTAALNLPNKLKTQVTKFGSGVSMRISKKLNASASRDLRPFTRNSGTKEK